MLESIPEDNHEYIIKQLSLRMKQSDFRFLHPQIQQMFKAKRDEHSKLLSEKDQKIAAMKAEYIPSDGPMIACDLYVEGDDKSKAPKRARIPARALEWLVKNLEAQSGPLERIGAMNGGEANASMRGMIPQGGGRPGGMPQPGGMPPGMMGQARPNGANYAG
jgi:hypothetical protein